MSDCRYYRTDWFGHTRTTPDIFVILGNAWLSIIGMVQKVKEHHVWHERKRDHVKCISLFFDFCLGEFTVIINDYVKQRYIVWKRVAHRHSRRKSMNSFSNKKAFLSKYSLYNMKLTEMHYSFQCAQHYQNGTGSLPTPCRPGGIIGAPWFCR